MICGDKQGTVAGVSRHRRNWETPCAECRAAAAAAARARRERNPEARAQARRDSNRRHRAVQRLIARYRGEFAELLEAELQRERARK